MPYRHQLERLADSIAGKASSRIDRLTNALMPPGSRGPFQAQVDLAWWEKNIDTEHGQAALKYLGPVDVLTLKQKLSERQRAAEVAPYGE